ncbi:MAG: (d)CMP kinase [Lachnospiraceae bacterium]
MHYNIAIDGPAGSGKSSIAKRLAKELKVIYVDTGAMYRAMALYFIRNNTDISQKNVIKEACEKINISISYSNNEQIILLNGENVNDYIRTEEVGNMASITAKDESVRNKLVSLQRELAKKESVIMDGRDIGTCVLPQANLKIFLTANVKTRAIRRYKELVEKGEACDLAIIEKDIEARDFQDMNREISPLKQAKDAIRIDSSDMTLDEVIAKIHSLCKME